MNTASISSRSIRFHKTIRQELPSSIELSEASAQIMMDFETRPVTVMGIKFRDEEADPPGRYRVNILDDERIRINAHSVVRRIGRDVGEGRYPCWWDSDSEMLLVDLTEDE